MPETTNKKAKDENLHLLSRMRRNPNMINTIPKNMVTPVNRNSPIPAEVFGSSPCMKGAAPATNSGGHVNQHNSFHILRS